MSEAPFPVERAPRPRRRLGYLMAASAATLWGVNGTVSKVILSSGVSSLRLTEVRSAGAFVGLAAILAVRAPQRMRVRPRELPFLALFGIGGLAFVQWLYFLAIHRVPIGIALLVQYLAPLLVALWARFVYREPVRRRVWLALAAAATYMLYLLLAEHAVGDRGAVALLFWGFGFATLFFSLLAPWWSFPGERVGDDVSLLGHLSAWHLPVWLLMAFMICLGTIVPFFLLVSALRQLPATRVAIMAMLEPVVATVVAWAWLGESLAAPQLAGALVVLTAILLAQTAR